MGRNLFFLHPHKVFTAFRICGQFFTPAGNAMSVVQRHIYPCTKYIVLTKMRAILTGIHIYHLKLIICDFRIYVNMRLLHIL